MPLTFAQPVAKGTVTIPIPGGDLGPGTLVMLEFGVTFANPVTAGNTILVFFAGDIIEPGANLFAGPGGSISYTPGGSMPATTYYVRSTYTSSSGAESAAGDERSFLVPANNLLVVYPPNNPNFPGGSVDGATGWNVYVSTTPGAETKQNSTPIAINTTWTEPSGGIATGGSSAPSTVMRDSLGNAYQTALWVPGGQGGSQYGTESIGAFYASNIVGGSNTVTFRGVGYNFNPFFGTSADLNLIAVELTAFPTPALQSQGFVMQGNATYDPSITIGNSASAPIVSDFGTQTQSVFGVVDLVSNGVDNFFALATGNALNTSVFPPTVTGSSYTELDHIVSAGNIPLYVWSSVPVAAKRVRGNIDWDQVGLDARHGDTLGILIQYSDGTGVAGETPVFRADGSIGGSGKPVSSIGAPPPVLTVNGDPTVTVDGVAVSFNDVVTVDGV